MPEQFSSNKVLSILVVALILGFLAGYFVFSYLPQQQKLKLINEYKKSGYETLLCEYNCPLSMQNVNNKTQPQLLPDSACVESCSKILKLANVSVDMFSAKELKNDNFFSDITNATSICKTKSVNMTSFTMDNRAYFSCVSEKLKALATNYPYVK